jgi:hypothetical protein
MMVKSSFEVARKKRVKGLMLVVDGKGERMML